MASLDDLEYGKPLLGRYIGPIPGVPIGRYEEQQGYIINLYHKRRWDGYERYRLTPGEPLILVAKVYWQRDTVFAIPLFAIMQGKAPINCIYRWKVTYNQYLPRIHIDRIEILE